MHITANRHRAFSMIELLVVIGIIVLLLAILIPSMLWAREAARRAQCASNQRQLMLGAMAFSNDHAGQLINASTSGGSSWVNSGNDAYSMASGAIFPYVNSGSVPNLATVDTYPPSTIKLFACPSDFVKTNIRSYSINTYLADLNNVTGYTIWKWSQIHNPAKTFYFIDEYDDRGYNVNGFAVNLPPPGGWLWDDIPGLFHSDGCNLTFADGHLEWWHWGDPRTLALTPGAAGVGLYTPNDADLLRIQNAGAP